MKRIPIGEATEAQLRTFAQETLGIDIKASASPEKVRAQIESAWSQETMPVSDVEPESEIELEQTGSHPEPITDDQQPPPIEMVRINIGIQEKAGGGDDVQVGVNGKIMLVPRGHDVVIPVHFLEVLQHAVALVYDTGEEGLGISAPREVLSYPFQIIARGYDLEPTDLRTLRRVA